MGIEPSPQVVRQAAVFVVAVFLAAALGCIDGFVDRADDVGHGDVGKRPGKVVAATGTAHAFDQLVPALVRTDVVPRVLAVYRRPADGPVVHPWVTDLRDRGIRADQIVDPGPMSLDVVRQMVLRVRRDSCDVLHTHDYKSNLLGGLAARRADAALPWIATVHLHTDATRRLRIYRALDLFLLRLADRVITVSREQQRLLRRRGVEPRRLVLVPNVIDVDAFRAGAGRPDRARSAVGLPRQGPVVAAVGRLAHQKGLDLFLEAAVGIGRQRPDCRFVIAGSGPLRPALERQVDLSGLRDRVHLVGYRSDVARLMLACDVVVLPSRSEGMPLVLLEALAMARPVVAARVGGVPEVLADGVGGWQHFDRERPDLVVLDLNMPKMSGFRLLELLRSESQVPVLILTAYDFAEAEEVANYRPNYFMNKPFDAQELIFQANCLIDRTVNGKACD